MDITTLIAERKIEEAIEKGEFDHLTQAGHPLDLDELFALPADVRMVYTLLRNSDHTAEDVTRAMRESRRRHSAE